jgi:hypothetical protein
MKTTFNFYPKGTLKLSYPNEETEALEGDRTGFRICQLISSLLTYPS